jgi:hypothetical protein
MSEQVLLVNNTPLETYHIHGVPILVKREDLCSPEPGPSFSKMRGVVEHIKNLPPGVHTIGVLDTYHSKAGWAVSYVCQALGKHCINFWPRFKADDYQGGTPPRKQQQRADSLGATMVDLQAGRSAVLYHQAKKQLFAHDPTAYMMPNALKLRESILANAAEAERTAPLLPYGGTVLVSISSGTVAAGVLAGFAKASILDRWDIILHMGYSRSQAATRAYIEQMSGIDPGKRVHFVDEGYGYKDVARDRGTINYPFPCNPHYDAKLWSWLHVNQNLAPLHKKPILMWNIGA